MSPKTMIIYITTILTCSDTNLHFSCKKVNDKNFLHYLEDSLINLKIFYKKIKATLSSSEKN